jgi:hypothetical protein
MQLRRYAIVLRQYDPTKATPTMDAFSMARFSHQRTSFATVYLSRTAQQRGHPKGVPGCVLERRIAGYRGNPKHIAVHVCEPQGKRVIVTRITVDNKQRAVRHIT